MAGCKPDDRRAQLIGSWKTCWPVKQWNGTDSVTTYQSVPWSLNIAFINDSIMEMPFHMYRRIPTKDHLRYCGYTTRYRIRQDSILYLNLADSTWTYFAGIREITSDLLELEMDGQDSVRFCRIKAAPDTTFHFDKIVLSSTGCEGYCPVADMMIDAQGTFIYNGKMYAADSGLFETHVSPGIFREVASRFEKADVIHLDSVYDDGATDNSSIITVFLHHDSIIQSIEDIGAQGTHALYMAYPHLKYLIQDVFPEPLNTSSLPAYTRLLPVSFEQNRLYITLTEAERFLLWDYLRKGALTTGSYEATWELRVNDPRMSPSWWEHPDQKEPRVETDGRYYTFHMQTGDVVTVDIGFNFLERNAAFLKPKSKM